MRTRFRLAATWMVAVVGVTALPSVSYAAHPPELVSVKRIWDAGKHNAFTDLLRWHDRWWCTFRESDAHVGGDGRIRVITSPDGEAWESAALIDEADVDLRDPKLSITPDERLMIVVGGSVYLGTKQLKGRQPRVMFSKDGRDWTRPQKVLEPGDWLWRVTWHPDGVAYGTTYSIGADPDKKPKDWSLRLVSSRDGIEWQTVAMLDIPGHPNEATLRFLPNREAIAFVRREAGNQMGWIGSAKAPYKEWTWQETDHRLGGPNFIVLPDGRWIAGTRAYAPGKTSMLLAHMTPTGLTPLLTLPSGGDCSYPGLAWQDGLLWVSYYSSHEGKSRIYLAKVKVDIPATTLPTTRAAER